MPDCILKGVSLDSHEKCAVPWSSEIRQIIIFPAMIKV